MYRLPDSRRFKNRVMLLIIIAVSILYVTPLISIIYTAVEKGGTPLVEAGLSFLTDLPPTPLSSGAGGIAPALVGSLLASILAILISTPVAFLMAFYVTEFPRHSLSRVCEVVVRSFSGVPSIVVSMFVYSTVVISMGRQSLLAGSLSLSIVTLPYAYVYFTSAFRSIPESLREAAMSLGMNRAGALIHVYVGVLRGSIVTGLLMSYVRAFGDTAPLLFTMGFLMNAVFAGVLQQSNAIPLMIFVYALSPYENFHRVAWGATLVLLLIYLTLFTVSRILVRGVRL